jgi:hypothetical protein
LLEVTMNPLLVVGGDSVTCALAAVLITVTFADLPRWPTTWSEKEIDVGLALSVAKTGLGEAVGTGVPVGVVVGVTLDAVAVGVAADVAVMVAVGVAAGVAVMLEVGVAVTVSVAVAVVVAVDVAVAETVAVAVGVGAPLPPANNPNTASRVCVPT